MWGRSVFLGVPRGLVPALPNLWGFRSIYACILCRKIIKVNVATQIRRGLVLGGQSRPTPRGWVPALPNFWGSLLFMRTPFIAELLNLICQHMWELGLVFKGVNHAPPQGAESQRSPIFGVPSAYAYTICRRTTKFDVVMVWYSGV